MNKILLTLAALLLWASPAMATTYYVATDGDDSRSCVTAQTIGTPFLTINEALEGSGGKSCLSAGDVLEIAAGTYVERLLDVIPSGTSFANAVTR